MAAKVAEFRIRICFENKTGRDDFMLVAFHEPSPEQSDVVVWRSVATQSRARFWYNSGSGVSVSYRSHDVEIESGPFETASGSLWTYTQDHPSFAGHLKEDISPTHTKDANTAIVMKNVKPIAWTGRRINCQLYRNGYLYAIQRDVPPNSSAYFALSHKLTFGIVMTQCIEPGTILPLSQVQYQWYLDMTEYVGCQLLTVSVEFNKCSGEFVFSETQQC